eukprot:734070-Rhodomonas_salina.2
MTGGVVQYATRSASIPCVGDSAIAFVLVTRMQLRLLTRMAGGVGAGAAGLEARAQVRDN